MREYSLGSSNILADSEGKYDGVANLKSGFRSRGALTSCISGNVFSEA